MRRNTKETIKAIVLSLVMVLVAGAVFYACTVLPMNECMDHGHSFWYCNKLLNQH